LDYGCWFDQHHGVENLRPDSIKPHPEQPIGGAKAKPTRALPPQDAHLMSQCNELKLQGGAASNTESEQGNERGKNCNHAQDGMAVAQISPGFLVSLQF